MRSSIPLYLAAACIGFWGFVVQRMVDQDLPGHLTFGQAAWLAGHVLQTDPYAYVPTRATWYNHEWLFEVFIWLVYRTWGASALLLWKGLCGAILAVSATAVAQRRGGHPLACLAILWAAFLGTAGFSILGFSTWGDMAVHTHVRPYVVTYTAFAVSFWLLELAESGRRWAWVALVILIGIWANCHAGFVMGIGATGAYLLYALWQKRETWKGHLAAIGASLVAACINPYGVHYLPFVVEAVTMKRPYITEFRPMPWELDNLLRHFTSTKVVLFSVWLAVLVSVRRDLRPIVILAFTTYQCLTAYRHVVLALVVCCAYGPEFISGAIERFWGGFRERLEKLTAWLAWLAVGAVLCFFCVWRLETASVPLTLLLPIRPMGGGPGYYFPADACRFLRANGVKGNLAVWFDWGEFIIWEFAPQLKVSFDGRLETIYPPNVVEENLQFLYGEAGWEKILNNYPTDYILIPPNISLTKVIGSRKDWHLIYQDRGALLFGHVRHRRKMWIMPPEFQKAIDWVVLEGPPTYPLIRHRRGPGWEWPASNPSMAPSSEKPPQ